jgi:hypothetical protein
MSRHRPEVGRTEGVSVWAEGQPYCTILCTNGHKKRTIDRVRWAGEEGRARHLYTGGFRLDDPCGDDSAGSSEENPTNDDYKWRFRCPSCRIDVVLSTAMLENLAEWVRATSARRIELSRLAAIVSG